MSQPPTPSSRPIRVMLVEDSPTERFLIQRLFALASDMVVVATAVNGREALDRMPSVDPDIICTDYHMPVMDGLEFIRQARQRSSCPIVVFSVAVQADQQRNIFRLLAAGAIDVLPKPVGSMAGMDHAEGRVLLEKIRAIARSPQARRPAASGASAPRPPAPLPAPGSARADIVAIGASTGGPQALQRLLSQLPAGFAAPLVVVQHISEGFLEGMLSWLQAVTRIRLSVATPSTVLEPGHAYFAPYNQHMLVTGQGRLRFTGAQPGDLHCPGVDPLMHSVAQVYGARAAGVLLTGMGRDGAQGLRAMRDAGATTIAQDEASCVIFGMPAVAISLGAATHTMPPEEMADTLARLAGTGAPNAR